MSIQGSWTGSETLRRSSGGSSDLLRPDPETELGVETADHPSARARRPRPAPARRAARESRRGRRLRVSGQPDRHVTGHPHAGVRPVPQTLDHLLALRQRGAAEGRHAARAVVRALPHPRPGLLETVRGLPGDLAAVDRGVHALFPGPETDADLHPARRHRRTGAGPAARGPGPRRPSRPHARLAEEGRRPRRTLQAVAGHSAVTHEALDTLPPGRTLVHLRSMLVAAGALPARDERLVALERWIGQVIAGRTFPEHRRALHGYAVWHQLRVCAAGSRAGPPPVSR